MKRELTKNIDSRSREERWQAYEDDKADLIESFNEYCSEANETVQKVADNAALSATQKVKIANAVRDDCERCRMECKEEWDEIDRKQRELIEVQGNGYCDFENDDENSSAENEYDDLEISNESFSETNEYDEFDNNIDTNRMVQGFDIEM